MVKCGGWSCKRSIGDVFTITEKAPTRPKGTDGLVSIDSQSPYDNYRLCLKCESASRQEKALTWALSVIVKTDCEADGSFAVVMAVVVMGGDSLGWTLDRADTLDTSALQITHPLIDSAGSQCRLDTLATGHRHSAPCSIVNRLPVTIFAAPASFPTKS